jgi:preprotein translocase SecE subunit
MKVHDSRFYKILRFLAALTLVPYGISTYKELKKVDWMTYWQTVKVTGFVILFSVITGIIVYGLDQLLLKLFDVVIKKAQ